MTKQLHNPNELADSPQFGWEQMQSLLDKNLPQQQSGRRATPFLTFFIAASLIIIFLLSSLVIRNIGPVKPGKQVGEMIALENTLPNDAASPGNTTTIISTNNNSISHDIAVSHGTVETFGKLPLNQLFENNESLEEGGVNVRRELFFSPVTALATITADRLPGLMTIHQPADREMKGTSTGTASKTSDKKIKKGSWDLSAGLAVNAMISGKQSLRPYPTAELRYNISDKFYVSAGVGAASPVAISSKGIDKTVYLNDTSINVSFYNNVKHYSRLTYADVPLMAGVKISKRLAVQAGVQASVLLHTKTRTAIEQYDFQMTMSNGLPAGLVTAAPPVSEEKYKVEARKIDYRAVAGIKYDMGKAALNVSYQYAPQPALTGNQVSGNRNQLVSVGMQLKIN